MAEGKLAKRHRHSLQRYGDLSMAIHLSRPVSGLIALITNCCEGIRRLVSNHIRIVSMTTEAEVCTVPRNHLLHA